MSKLSLETLYVEGVGEMLIDLNLSQRVRYIWNVVCRGRSTWTRKQWTNYMIQIYKAVKNSHVEFLKTAPKKLIAPLLKATRATRVYKQRTLVARHGAEESEIPPVFADFTEVAEERSTNPEAGPSQVDTDRATMFRSRARGDALVREIGLATLELEQQRRKSPLTYIACLASHGLERDILLDVQEKFIQLKAMFGVSEVMDSPLILNYAYLVDHGDLQASNFDVRGVLAGSEGVRQCVMTAWRLLNIGTVGTAGILNFCFRKFPNLRFIWTGVYEAPRDTTRSPLTWFIDIALTSYLVWVTSAGMLMNKVRYVSEAAEVAVALEMERTRVDVGVQVDLHLVNQPQFGAEELLGYIPGVRGPVVLGERVTYDTASTSVQTGTERSTETHQILETGSRDEEDELAWLRGDMEM